MQENDVGRGVRRGEDGHHLTKVRHSAHADSTKNLRRIIHHALGEVVYAPDLELSGGSELKDPEPSGEKGSSVLGSWHEGRHALKLNSAQRSGLLEDDPL